MNILELKQKAIELGIDFTDPEVETQEQAEIIGEYIDYLDFVKRKLTGGLKKYIQENGEVFTENKKWRERVSIRYSLSASNIDSIVERVAEHFNVSEDEVWEQTKITPSIFSGQKLKVDVQEGDKVKRKSKPIPVEIYEELGADKKESRNVSHIKRRK